MNNQKIYKKEKKNSNFPWIFTFFLLKIRKKKTKKVWKKQNKSKTNQKLQKEFKSKSKENLLNQHNLLHPYNLFASLCCERKLQTNIYWISSIHRSIHQSIIKIAQANKTKKWITNQLPVKCGVRSYKLKLKI